MAKNTALNNKRTEAARRDGRSEKEKAAALTEHVRRRPVRILSAFGTFEFDPAYDYKSERRKRRLP